MLRHLLPVAMVLTMAVLLLPVGPASLLPAAGPGGARAAQAIPALGDYIILSWNDLGMHCMNLSHANLSVLPPYNNLYAQVIRRGSASTPPAVVTEGVTLEYSIPGNTYSVGKTDFWTYAPALFGVTLPPDVGLTGKGLSGSLDLSGNHYVATGIPITPFTDAQPSVEDPYQQATVIARDLSGVELARSAPVVPVSVEMGCVSSGCHASELEIVQDHEAVSGYDPGARPILCARCHADPALGAAGRPDAGYFSMRMHAQHTFLDEQRSGTAVCYACHPGVQARCLRGVMAATYGLVCQDCHGNMAQMAASIESGRVPWAGEPSCRTCHTSRFGEPFGQLVRQSQGHNGVWCEGCHNSPHAEVPSAQPRDNENVIALQGEAAVLRRCVVCHTTTPAGPGPHNILASTDVPEEEIFQDARPLAVYPNPMRTQCAIRVRAARPEGGTLLVFDVQGRTVRLLRPQPAGSGWLAASWDGRDATGARLRPGAYFVRWQQGAERSAAKLALTD